MEDQSSPLPPWHTTAHIVEGGAWGRRGSGDLKEGTAGAEVAVGGRSHISAEALPSWSSSVSSESSERRVGPPSAR